MKNFDWDTGFGFILGTILTWIGIIVFVNLVILLFASMWAFVFWDSSVYITTAHMFNPLEHMWMRIVGIILMFIAGILHRIRHGI